MFDYNRSLVDMTPSTLVFLRRVLYQTNILNLAFVLYYNSPQINMLIHT